MIRPIAPVLQAILHERYVAASAFESPFKKREENDSIGFNGVVQPTSVITGIPPTEPPSSGPTEPITPKTPPKTPASPGRGRRYSSYEPREIPVPTTEPKNIFRMTPDPMEPEMRHISSAQFKAMLNDFLSQKSGVVPAKVENVPTTGMMEPVKNFGIGFGKFGIANLAGYYPYKITHETMKKSAEEAGLPEIASDAFATSMALPPAVVAGEAAISGVPAAASAIKSGQGLLKALQLGSAATDAASASVLSNPLTWVVAGQLMLTPHQIRQEAEFAQKRAKMLQDFETKESNKQKTLAELGLSQEEDWLDKIQKGFARAQILDNPNSIGRIGRDF